MSRIIAIAGPKGSGKTSVSEYLRDYEGFDEVSFARPLKEFARSVFQFTQDQLYGPSSLREQPDARYPPRSEARMDVEDRAEGKLGEQFIDVVTHYSAQKRHWVAEAMDDWLTLIMRHPETWTPRFILQTLGTDFGRRLHPDVWVRLAFDHKYPKMVISDARFDNEFLATVKNGGELWSIERPGLVHTDMHASEQDMHGVVLERLKTRTLMNDKSLTDLLDFVRTIV